MASFIKKLEKLKPGPIRYSHADYVAEVIALLAILSSFLILWFNWSSLSDPALIASNRTGIAVRMYSRNDLFIFQFVTAGVYIVFTIISIFHRWYPCSSKVAAENAAKEAMDLGLRQVAVEVKGPGAGREAAIRSLQVAGLEIISIKDVTPIPHNGCRPPKKRRV